MKVDIEEALAKFAAKPSDGDALIEHSKQGTPAAKIFTQMKSLARVANKTALARRCRNELPDECLGWIDASLILHVDDSGELDQTVGPLSKDAMKPKLEFSRLFMQVVADLILGKDRERSVRLAKSLLSGEATTGLSTTASGLFELGSAGGFNTGPGFESKDLPNNPWKIALVFEGCVFWSGNVSRRASTARTEIATVGPFTTRHVAGGVGASGHADSENALTEVWTPIWMRPTSAMELGSLLSEGRARIAGREPRNAIEFAEAVSSLGVDRGVTAFVRYSIVERRGPSYMAAASGRLDVRFRAEVDLLRQLEGELARLDGFLRRFKGEGPPAQLVSRRRAVDDARFDVAQRGGSDAMRRLVRALGALEMLLAKRDPGKAPTLGRPLGGLGPEWIDACGDTVEVRLAAAIASIAATGGAGPFRAYVAPLDSKNVGRYAPSARALAWAGVDIADRLSNVLRRRLIDVRKQSENRGPLGRNPTWGLRRASLSDVAIFLAGDLVDEQALEELLFGFTLVKPTASDPRFGSDTSPPLSRVYAQLRLLCLPDGIPKGDERVRVLPDPALIGLLRAGRISDAVDVGRRQLVAKGFRPRRVINAGVQDIAFGRRIAAALLIPVSGTPTLFSRALLSDSEPASFDLFSPNIESEETLNGH